MNHAYWIGGGSCSGKSSVADVIGESTGLKVVHLDDWVPEILDATEERTSPAMNWYRTAGSSKWFAKGGTEAGQRYVDSLREEMHLSLPYLEKAVDAPVIIEGNCFLPDMAGDLSPGGRHIWILASDDFREARYGEREFAGGILDLYDDPELAWRNWMDRDHYQATYVRSSAEKLGLEIVEVDGSRDVQSIAATVAAKLGLAAS